MLHAHNHNSTNKLHLLTTTSWILKLGHTARKQKQKQREKKVELRTKACQTPRNTRKEENMIRRK
jgi:hypothetical protein